MKKSVLIILAAFLLAACGPAQEPSEPAAESSLASEETESSQVSQPESSPESSAEPDPPVSPRWRDGKSPVIVYFRPIQKKNTIRSFLL